MMRSRIAMLLALFGAACQGTTSQDEIAPPLVGGLALHMATDGVEADSATFEVRGPGIDAPVSGSLSIVDGEVTAQVTEIPAGEGRSVELSLVKDGQVVCVSRAEGISIPAGHASQVRLLPQCLEPEQNIDVSKNNNHAPKILAIVASRQSAKLGELVALSVSVQDQDGDPLTFHWTESVPGAGFTDASRAATIWTAGPAGASNKLTVTVKDNHGGEKKASVTVAVQGTVLGAATCEAPQKILMGQTLTGSTIGAASLHNPTGCPVGNGAPERVFKLKLDAPTDFSVSVRGSFFNALVYVRRADCGTSSSELACADLGQRGLEFVGAAPGTYYIFVDGASIFDQGEFSLTVQPGKLPEDCTNGIDDDGDGAFDCADDQCTGVQGCLECAASCDVDPTDCLGGNCDRFSGHCFVFGSFGNTCDLNADPSTLEGICDGSGGCVVNTAVCGNGQIEIGEECDDSNTTGGDGCEANCKLTRCGEAFCNDGNPCTVDVCTDAATSTCTFTPVADGLTCEGDGIPETADTCQAGLCVIEPPAPPDAALMILDPTVLDDPAFSFQSMHDRLAVGANGAALFEQWAATIAATMTVENGRTVAGRPSFAAFVAGLPRRTDGSIDLAAAGFVASAFVNRLDLRTPGDCGESRVVYTKETGATDSGNRMTIIFEFGVPDDGSNCQNASLRWAALRGLTGEALRIAAVQLMLDNSQAHLLNQMRTNEFVVAPFWELREFHLNDGVFGSFPVAETPPFALAQDVAFRQLVIQNAALFNQTLTGIIPLASLDAASRADGTRLNFGQIVPSMPGLEANINLNTCSGCHLTETATSFVHVAERLPGQPSALSFFLRSELDRRVVGFDQLLNTPIP